MSRTIFSYPIANHVRSKLVTAKLVALEDIQAMTAESLSAETGLSIEETKELFILLGLNDEVKPKNDSCSSFTCAEQLQLNRENCPITTFSKNLDSLLGGGISRVTEVCGVPGTGKTQLCLQLAVNVQLPKRFGGWQSEALYIDNEGSFNAERLKDMAEAAIFSCDPVPTGLTVDDILNGVHYCRCTDCASLLDTVNELHDFISTHPKVKLVVIDNITYHFRRNFDSNYGLRSRTLQNMSLILAELAQKCSMAVVLTNQMTTRIDGNHQTTVVPSLGDGWSHACCNRLVLNFNSEMRSAVLIKSSYRPNATAYFQIESAGIRDVCTENRYSNSADARLGISDLDVKAATSDEDALGTVAKRPRLDVQDHAHHN